VGRCHVVTGGCRGVGRALAERLLDDGGTVAAVELDPAAAVAHLLSDAASFVNGATVPVDGGRSVLGPDPRRATRAVGVPRR